MNGNDQIIRKLIRKESLRMIKESQASFLKEDSGDVKSVIQDVDDGIIEVNEKRLDKLEGEEKSAREKEDFAELKRVKEEQVASTEKLIRGYARKVELLTKTREELQKEMLEIQTNGSGIFKNQEMTEFSNERFEKDWGLRIETPNTSTGLVKIMDTNAYKVIDTNIPSLETNDLLQLPDLKIGGSGDVKVYRKVGDRHDNVANFKIDNITKMIKNPQ
jgi:hypothetical protein